MVFSIHIFLGFSSFSLFFCRKNMHGQVSHHDNHVFKLAKKIQPSIFTLSSQWPYFQTEHIYIMQSFPFPRLLFNNVINMFKRQHDLVEGSCSMKLFSSTTCLQQVSAPFGATGHLVKVKDRPFTEGSRGCHALICLYAQPLSTKERHVTLPLVIATFIMQSVAFILHHHTFVQRSIFSYTK